MSKSERKEMMVRIIIPFMKKTRQLKEGDTLLTLFGFKTIQINPIKQRGNSINQGFSKSN